jgi:hypothetical protein
VEELLGILEEVFDVVVVAGIKGEDGESSS